MADIINLDGDIAIQNASTLHDTAADLPASATVAEVLGNRKEPAAIDFTSRLESAAGKLGDSIENLREFVALNADALANAVQALLDTDRMNADAAGDATELINDMAAMPPAGGTGAAPNTSVQSSTRRDFGGAF
ncbi:hypothetical protein [Microbacterium sp. P05]|uniref:hypothetical protein n=1 Tax=Microbacterium sp. P05 TaxID=3366948 RepID=UPI0037476376